MRFEAPNILFLLWLVIPLAGLLIWFFRRRRCLLEQFAQGGLWQTLAGSVGWRTRRRKNVLLIVVFLLSLIALARPQWGFELQQVKREGVNILLAIDVSKSMLTEDVSPNRLERTKLAVRDLIERLHGDRIGLIAFAGDAFEACPLTSDYGGVILSLDNLDTGIIPRGGTNIASAVQEAMKVYDEAKTKHKILVIMTDGENLESDPLAMVKKTKAAGIKIYTIGIGTKEGELIRAPDGQGGFEFLKDKNGNFVKSRLNESLLQDIALATGGLYVRASGAQFGLDMIYDHEFSKLKKTEFKSRMRRRYFERFQWPLGLALILLVIATILPERRDGSIGRDLSSKGEISPSKMADRARRSNGAPGASRPAIFLLLLCFCVFVPGKVFAAAVYGTVNAGNKAFEKQDYKAASEKYKKALNKDKESDIIHFNAGAADYKLGNYDQAAQHFQKALLSEDAVLRQQAHYNLGNAFYRSAESVGSKNPQTAAPLLEKSLAQYEQALAINKEDKDAKYNYDFVKKVLKKIKEQIKKQKKQCRNPQNTDKGKTKKENGQQGQQKQQQKGQQNKQQAGQQQKKKGEEQKTANGQKQQNQQNKEKGQQSGQKEQKKQQQGGQGEKDKGQKSKDQQAASSGQQKAGELSQREAQMMLKNYENNEEPKGLLNLRGTFDTRPVLKDW